MSTVTILCSEFTYDRLIYTYLSPSLLCYRAITSIKACSCMFGIDGVPDSAIIQIIYKRQIYYVSMWYDILFMFHGKTDIDQSITFKKSQICSKGSIFLYHENRHKWIVELIEYEMSSYFSSVLSLPIIDRPTCNFVDFSKKLRVCTRWCLSKGGRIWHIQMKTDQNEIKTKFNWQLIIFFEVNSASRFIFSVF